MRAFQLIRHGSAKDVFKDVVVPKPTLKKEQDVLKCYDELLHV